MRLLLFGTLILLNGFFLGAAGEDFALADGTLRRFEVSVEEVAGEEDWAGDAHVNERVPIRSPQRIPTETNHRHHLRPGPTTLIIFRAAMCSQSTLKKLPLEIRAHDRNIIFSQTAQ